MIFARLGWIFLGSLLFLVAAHANTPPRAVSVSGSCLRQVTPDRGALSMVSEARDTDLPTATQKSSKAYERARDAIKKLGLPDVELRTTEYSVSEIREWENNKSVFKGFKARMGLQVSTSATQRLGEVIAIASREGLVDVGSLSMFLSDEKTKKERFACLQAAAEDARAKADRLATSLGAKVGPVLSISEGGASSPAFPRPEFKAMADVAMARGGRSMEPPAIEAGQQDMTVQVSVTFALQ